MNQYPYQETFKENEPEAGFYLIRRVKGGILMPVRIWIAEDGPVFAKRGFDLVPWDWIWPWCARHPVDETEYQRRMARKVWARENDKESPEANPKRPIDLDDLPPIF